MAKLDQITMLPPEIHTPAFVMEAHQRRMAKAVMVERGYGAKQALREFLEWYKKSDVGFYCDCVSAIEDKIEAMLGSEPANETSMVDAGPAVDLARAIHNEAQMDIRPDRDIEPWQAWPKTDPTVDENEQAWPRIPV